MEYLDVTAIPLETVSPAREAKLPELTIPDAEFEITTLDSKTAERPAMGDPTTSRRISISLFAGSNGPKTTQGF